VVGRCLLKLLAAALALASTGCVLHVQRDLEPPPRFHYEPPQGAMPPFESFERTPVQLSEPFDQTRTHEIVRITFPSSGRNGHPQNIVEGQYFRAKGPGRKSLVVVMPIWGTSSYPPAKISTGYARRAGNDTNVIWIYGNAPVFPWDELSSVPTEEGFRAMARDSVERYRSAVIDMRRLVDWAAMQPDVDASRIAFVGFSMSALVTATLLANEPRVSAGVLMMGAARYSDIFSQCRNRAGEVREHALRAFGWTADQYHDFFEALFAPADPVRFEGRYDPNKILMIDAMFDDCMPESSRAALWEITGHPQRVTFLYQHRSAFYSLTPIGLNVSRRKIYRFLDSALGRDRSENATSSD
jgi:dienelactone hydrolase